MPSKKTKPIKPKNKVYEILRDDADEYESVEWWTANDNDAAGILNNTIGRITKDQANNETFYLELYKRFLNRNVSSISSLGLINKPSGLSFEDNMTYNVTKMCVDAISNKVAKNKVRAYFLTSKGNPDLQDKAKMMTAYVDHVFEAQKVPVKMEQIFRDQCVFGTGALKVSVEFGNLVIDRVRIMDLRIDEQEALDGEPAQMHHVKLVSRSVMKAMYPERAADIDEAPVAKQNNKFRTSQLIEVRESWHLRSGPNASDGVRMISLENVILERSPYVLDRFPFVFIKWTKPLIGFHGIGLVEELSPIQDELNEVIARIQEALKFSVPRVFLSSQTDTDETQFNDLIGTIIRYDGALSPVIGAGSTVSGETLKWKDDLFEKAFACSGISELSATSKKPASLESGAAMEEYMDIETERFSLTALSWEEAHLDLADLIIRISRQLYSGKSKIKIRTDDGRYLESKFWRDIELPEESMELSKFPTPFLPKTPSGQIQTVINLIQGGLASPDQGRSLLNFPDTEAFYKQSTAKERACRKIINDILSHGKVIPPSKYLPLDMLTETALDLYTDAITNDSIDPKNIDLLENYLDQLGELQSPEPAPEGMPPMVGPDGAPMPPGPPGAPPPPPPPDQAPLIPVSTVSSPGLPPPPQ